MTTDTLERTNETLKSASFDLELDGIISAYLYYLEYDGGTAVVREAIYEYYDRPGATVDRENLILQLATNAHTGGDDPIPYTTDHQYFMMRRKSYLIIVAAKAADIDQINPIEFVGEDSAGTRNDGRHTFQNVEFSEISFGSTPADRLQIVTCENHMQSKARKANLLPREWEKFEFTLNFSAAAVARLAPDSGGTNMGPPVPPPGLLAGMGRPS